MTPKAAPISFKGHEAFGAEVIRIYSKIGMLGMLCIQHYNNSILPKLALQAQTVINALAVELDKQFKEDYPDDYQQEIYFH